MKKYFNSTEEERVYDCIVNWRITKATTAATVAKRLNMDVNEVVRHIKNLEEEGLLVQDFC